MSVESIGSVDQVVSSDAGQGDFDNALTQAREEAEFNEQLISGGISALAPTLLMRLAGDILQEAQSEE